MSKRTCKSLFLPRQEFLSKNNVSGNDSSQDIVLKDQHKNLYEMLDTRISGIAEWIIPLVVGADLDHVCWIKNDWCHQFLNNEYTFSVGAWDNHICRGDDNSHQEVRTFLDLSDEATIKTSLFHPYYMDDDSSVQESELMLKKPLHLVVADSMNSIPIEEEKDWILDICLDYFYCRNPFIDELICHFGEDLTQLLVCSVHSTKFRQDCIINKNIVDKARYREDLCTFQRVSKILFETYTEKMNTMEGHFLIKEWTINDVLSAEENHNLLSLYSSPEDAENLWNDILDGILRVYLADQRQNQKDILDILLNALPNLSLPHQSSPSIASLSDASCILDIQEKVKGFGKQLRSISPETTPLCVTLARSSDDGFTPSCVTDTLQNALFEELHSIFCNCSRPNDDANSTCKIKFLKDYGDSEGSSLEEMHL